MSFTIAVLLMKDIRLGVSLFLLPVPFQLFTHGKLYPYLVTTCHFQLFPLPVRVLLSPPPHILSLPYTKLLLFLLNAL